MSQLGNIQPRVSLFLKAKDGSPSASFNGELASLCQKVSEHKSIYTAAAETGMSYGKAWRMVKEAEAALGFPLFTRGGCKGSSLTEEGAKLLEAYQGTLRHLESTAEIMLEKMIEERFCQNGETASAEESS